MAYFYLPHSCALPSRVPCLSFWFFAVALRALISPPNHAIRTYVNRPPPSFFLLQVSNDGLKAMRRHRRGLSAVFAAGSLTVLLVLWGMGQATTAAPIDVAAEAGLTGSPVQAAGIAPVMVADAVVPQHAKDEIIPSVGVEEDEDGDEWKEREEEEEDEDEEVYVEEDEIRAPLPVKAAPTKATTGKKLRQLEDQGDAGAEGAEKAAAAPSPFTIATTASTRAAAPAAPAAAVPYKETRELPWETEAWQRDLDELKALLDTDIEPAALEAEASSLAADIGSEGHIETMGSLGNVMNIFSSSPDPVWPFCSPGGILYKVGLVCPVMSIAAKILMRSPPDFGNYVAWVRALPSLLPSFPSHPPAAFVLRILASSRRSPSVRVICKSDLTDLPFPSLPPSLPPLPQRS